MGKGKTKEAAVGSSMVSEAAGEPLRVVWNRGESTDGSVRLANGSSSGSDSRLESPLSDSSASPEEPEPLFAGAPWAYHFSSAVIRREVSSPLVEISVSALPSIGNDIPTLFKPNLRPVSSPVGALYLPALDVTRVR